MTEEEIETKFQKSMQMLQILDRLSKSAGTSYEEHLARNEEIQVLARSVQKLKAYELAELRVKQAEEKAKPPVDDEQSEFNFDFAK